MSSDPLFLDQSVSVTRLIEELKQDDISAAEEIWRLYFQRLLPVARAKLVAARDPAVDEEDILISVFDRFFRAASQGRFANLNDRDDLWQILLVLTERKIVDHHRRSSAAKRGRDLLTNQSACQRIDIGELRELADRGPSPEYVAAFNEHLTASFRRLGKGNTRQVAVMRLEGYSNHEISQELDISLRSVERKLRVIREAWEELL